jgi:hypothetical protein
MSKLSGGHAPIDFAIGAEVINDTAAHTGQFSYIAFYENSTITEILSENVTDNDFASATVDASTALEGYFTSIQLQNGACIAYKI